MSDTTDPVSTLSVVWSSCSHCIRHPTLMHARGRTATYAEPSPELSVIVFMSCVNHLTKCSTIVTSPTVIKSCCVWPPVSALLMTLPRNGQLLTLWLLPLETQVLKHALVLMLPQPQSPCCLPTHDMYMDHQRWWAAETVSSRPCLWRVIGDLCLCWLRLALVTRAATAVIGGS